MIRRQNLATLAGILALFSVFILQEASAQTPTDAPGPVLQIGPGLVPGVGVEVAYLDMERMYTRDVVFYSHVQTGVLENEGSLQLTASLGVTARIIGILETMNLARPRSFDIHIGARIGPGLTFGFDETSLEKNQRFSLTLEPIARYVQQIGRRDYFVELGIVRPSLRFGTLISL